MSAVFWSLYVYCLAERVTELVISRCNQRRMHNEGFVERESATGLRTMIALHASWYICTALEAAYAPTAIPSALWALALVLFLLSQALRVWTLRTLGHLWNISVMTENDESSLFVAHGPYRYIRHPNYLVVITEIVTLPLMGGALLTATTYSLLNALVLRRRIKLEEANLFAIRGYVEAMGHKGCLIPQVQRRSSH